MKTIATWCLATATALLLQGNAWALPVAGDQVKLYDYPGYGTSQGGAFQIDVLGKGSSVDYISFCLEMNEYIAYNTTYTIDSVADYAVAGGNGAIYEDGELRDYVSDETKWVFWNYLQGTLDFGTVTDSNQQANAVQYAIWVLEQELTLTDLAKYGSLYTNLYSSWFSSSTKDYSIDGIVKVLNLSENGVKRQSQLIGEAAPVPEPTTMLLFGTGLIGLAGMARRRQKAD